MSFSLVTLNSIVLSFFICTSLACAGRGHRDNVNATLHKQAKMRMQAKYSTIHRSARTAKVEVKYCTASASRTVQKKYTCLCLMCFKLHCNMATQVVLNAATGTVICIYANCSNCCNCCGHLHDSVLDAETKCGMLCLQCHAMMVKCTSGCIHAPLLWLCSSVAQ